MLARLDREAEANPLAETHVCAWSGDAPEGWLRCRTCGGVTRKPQPLDRERFHVLYELK